MMSVHRKVMMTITTAREGELGESLANNLFFIFEFN